MREASNRKQNGMECEARPHSIPRLFKSRVPEGYAREGLCHRERRLGSGDFGRRNLLGGHHIDELRITWSAHLGDIQTGDFDFRRHAVGAEHLADDEEDHAADDDIPADAGGDVDELGDELLGVAVEQAVTPSRHALIVVPADDVPAGAVGAVGEEAERRSRPTRR